jgi:hypothetical protein
LETKKDSRLKQLYIVRTTLRSKIFFWPKGINKKEMFEYFGFDVDELKKEGKIECYSLRKEIGEYKRHFRNFCLDKRTNY